MKINFTRSALLMILFFAILSIFNTLNSNAQILHEVTVTSNMFTPSSLTIDVGDTVRWSNTEGNHNVNGMIATFPSNPESFGNSVGGPGWTYEFVFTIEGTYNYQCDPHASLGMTGTITVSGTSGLSGFYNLNRIKVNLYPVPAREYVNFELPGNLFQGNEKVTLSIFNAIGEEIYSVKNITDDRVKLSLDAFDRGIYFYRFSMGLDNIMASGKLVIE